MANPKGRFRGRGKGKPGAKGSLALRELGENRFALMHPACVEERAEDYEEAMEVWRAGEAEEARDMLRYALEGCSDNVFIHAALGRMALEEGRNVELARGHLGYAFELVRQALPGGFGFGGRLPREVGENLGFHQALEGLIACALEEGDGDQVEELQKLQRRMG